MMDFEERVRELNKYVPILEGFIDKLSGDPTKASHVQSIKNVKSLITERLLTESNINKCEAVLRKLDQMHKKESQEQMLQERINKLITRYGPFLENCIQKLEKCDSTKPQSHLATMRKLMALLTSRSLTHENIDICEISLQQLDEKVEKNTIDRIRARIESDTKKEEVISDKKEHGSSKKAKIIPFEDNVLFDLTSGGKRYNPNTLAFAQDPRTQSKSYIDRSRTPNKTILLEIIQPYNESTLGHPEDRLALRYKTKKKAPEPVQESTLQSLDNHNVSAGKSSAFDNLSLTFMNATMSYSTVSTASMNRAANNVPQMVPPPQPINNQAYADIVQQLCGEFNALQPIHKHNPVIPSATGYSNAPLNYNTNMWDKNGQTNQQNSMMLGGQNLMPNSVNPPAQNSMFSHNSVLSHSQNAIMTPSDSMMQNYGNTDPRLSRNRNQLYDPVAALEQAPSTQNDYDQRDSSYNSSRYGEPNSLDYELNDRDPRSLRRDSISERRPRTPPRVDYRGRNYYDRRERNRSPVRNRSPNRYDREKRRDKDNNRSRYRKDNERDRDRVRHRSPEQTWDNESGPSRQLPLRSDNCHQRNRSPEEMWDDECQPEKPALNARRDSETSSQTSEKSSVSSFMSRDQDKVSIETKSGPSGNFKIPKLGERKSYDAKKEKSDASSNMEKQQKVSLKQKDFEAELNKLDKSERSKTKKKESDPEVDENSLLEQLSKVYGADKLSKIKTILEKENKKKKSRKVSKDDMEPENVKPKKQMKRVRTISTDEENENGSTGKTKLKEPKIEPPDLELQVTSPRKAQKKKARDSSIPERSPQIKKIKKEPLEVVSVSPKAAKDVDTVPAAKISPNKNKKKKTELDKLNEDIDNMFIRDGVLHATGRRQVTQKDIHNCNEEEFYGIKVKKSFVLITRCDDKNKSRTKSKPKGPKSKVKEQSSKYKEVPNKIKEHAGNDRNIEENISISEMVQNTNPNYHLQSEKANTCLLCTYNGVNIVEHYMKKHSNKEVFISRFNPDVAKAVKENPIAKNTTLCSVNVYNVNAKLKLRCGFCMQELISTRRLWKMHFMQHTGEFHCKSCKVSDPYPTDSRKYRADYPHRTSCKAAKKFTIDDLSFHASGLDAFMCSDCNFVQLTEDNIKQHITTEHGNASDMQPIRFLIIGFDKTKADQTQSIELSPQKTPQEKTAKPIVNNSEHAYAMPKPIKSEPDIDNLSSNIPKPLIVKQEPSESSVENKMSFSVSINHKNRLKVWSAKPSFKTDNTTTNMLQLECLYAFYKCMHPMCGYFTPIKELIESHLHGHLSDTIECCYCDVISEGISLYLEHMDETHRSNVYQCGYCFYRSCAAFNVVTHENHYHREEPNKILICPGRPSLLVHELDHIYENRAKYVPSLTCSICFYKTYIQDEFIQHLNTHKERLIKCQSCTSMVPKHTILQHLLTHRIGLYECVYCFYGTMSLESIRLHMSTVHPTKLLYVTARLKRNVKDQSMDNTKLESTVLAHVGQNVDKNIILCQETVGSPQKTSSVPESFPSPNKGQLKSAMVSNLPKISSVVSFGEPVTSPKSLTVINPVSICSSTPQQPTKVISPNTKLILQGSTSYKPGTKVILKTVGTNQSSAPLKVIKMADGKFVRLNGMPLTSQTSFATNLSNFNAKVPTPSAQPEAVSPTSIKITKIPEDLPEKTISANTPNKDLVTSPAELSLTTSDAVINPDTLVSKISSEIPLIMPQAMNSNTIDPIKEEINLGAILMEDDELM